MISIRLYQDGDKQLWDTYVMSHTDATHCHLSGWKDVIEKTYGHKGYYLIAERSCGTNNSSNLSREMRPAPCSVETTTSGSLFHWDSINSINPSNSSNSINPSNPIVGLLPLVHIKSLIFGNQLVSMPFLNYGGILADNEETEIALLSEALKLGQKLKASTIELRHLTPLSCLNGLNSVHSVNSSTATPQHCSTAILPPTSNLRPLTEVNPSNPINCVTKTHKLRLLLQLPGSSDELFKSYNAKLRSQIRRPQKGGMDSMVGGSELLDDFYRVFSINMRDLGSPVHSKNLFREILKHFDQNIKIGIVTYKGESVAAGMIIRFKNVIEIPWASSLRKYNQFSPNMLLYWSFVEYACKNGHQYFDFGRSTPNEGPHKFKEQWGPKPFPMYWHNIVLNGRPPEEDESEKSRYETAIRYWKKLPLPISNALGPLIRKHISL